MKIFITGGTGFIGSAIAKKAKANKHEVTILCRSRSSCIKLESQGYKTVTGVMEKPDSWIDEASQADALIHAAQLRPGKRLSNSWLKKCYLTRNTALEGLVAAAKKGKKCSALIYTSGIVAHGGGHKEAWIDESTIPTENPLGEYHLAGEKIINNAVKDGVPALAIRPGMVYGNAGTFATFFLAVAAKGKFQFPGDGNNFLPFVHVDDLAEAYMLAIGNPPIGKIISVVDNAPITMKEVAELLLEQFNGGKAQSVPAWLVSLFTGESLAKMLVGSYRVKNNLAKELLGWEPKRSSFVSGLPDVVNEYTTSLSRS